MCALQNRGPAFPVTMLDDDSTVDGKKKYMHAYTYACTDFLITLSVHPSLYLLPPVTLIFKAKPIANLGAHITGEKKHIGMPATKQCLETLMD
eukprot:gnl/TRDRNA2_/TRDRNA2_151769_c0_seq4.p2 gnl/TRDRNA2_/TRDRNA2_151769_c0~~gnl/TRDRNA2_/TRDRNA2_151769_c0_seq4.p2  ORF type:complete len:103 (-),score=8.26 gnl/TRDRNA2_/TRDRNA2_151769_c0_seq4:29-307(-)